MVDTDEQGNVVPVAEKLTDIIIMFDVKPDGSITANDVPVPMVKNVVGSC